MTHLGSAGLLLDDPTVGVDVGSKREILMEVRGLARTGKGIVLVSSEFEELSGVADRVLLLRDGAIVRVLDRAAGDDLTEEALSRAVGLDWPAELSATAPDAPKATFGASRRGRRRDAEGVTEELHLQQKQVLRHHLGGQPALNGYAGAF
mgnify:CR=1 FL=1